ncbi:hypothetical protein PInf_004960 [Phytophthora infestans]|nr:hypothetical protein PInf_004960 [Phytophthora infestans]
MDVYTDKLDLTIPKVTEATSTVTSEYRNWVGPRPVSPDGACYREAHFMDTCPKCGMQCIRQNDDCAMETLNKIGAVGNSVMAIAAFGAFQKLLHVSDGVRLAFECANIMIGTMRSIIRYIRNIKTTDPTASTDKIMNTLSDIGIVTNNCMEQLIKESDEATAYKTRETIRTAFSGMVEDLVSKGKSKNGSDEDGNYFMYQAFEKTLISIAVTGFDMIGVMGLIASYLQTICGPTIFMAKSTTERIPKHSA